MNAIREVLAIKLVTDDVQNIYDLLPTMKETQTEVNKDLIWKVFSDYTPLIPL